MPALTEYATLSSHRSLPVRLPQNLGEAIRWAAALVVAYLVVRLLAAMMRGRG